MKKLFKKQGTFTVCTIISVLFFVASFVFKIISAIKVQATWYYTYAAVEVILIISIIAFYVAFKKHEKNVQKALLGALTMAFLVGQMIYAVGVLENVAKAEYSATIVFEVLLTALFIIFYFYHLTLGTEHKSTPQKVYIVQVCAVLMVILCIVTCIFEIPLFNETIYQKIESIATTAGMVFFVLMIMSYDTMIDNFKLIRQNKTEK